jgi:hypothetical protein
LSRVVEVAESQRTQSTTAEVKESEDAELPASTFLPHYSLPPYSYAPYTKKKKNP